MMNKISDDNYYNRPANVQFSFEFTKCTMAKYQRYELFKKEEKDT